MHVKELGHLVLYVKDLARSRRFYGELLGWNEITPEGGMQFPAAAFTSGRTHHELLLIEVGASAAPLPKGRRLGLYHFGLKVGETDDELREARDALQAAGAKATRSSSTSTCSPRAGRTIPRRCSPRSSRCGSSPNGQKGGHR